MKFRISFFIEKITFGLDHIIVADVSKSVEESLRVSVVIKIVRIKLLLFIFS